jgi:NET1-associated nuclear protein 1 (U3 small nucleolar RNA-associated protein 17)
MYAVGTCEVVRVLKGHIKAVTAVALNPSNHLQLFTASMDGTVRLWDYVDAVCLRVIKLDAPVKHLLFVPTHPNAFLYVTDSMASKKGSQVMKSEVRIFRLQKPAGGAGAGAADGEGDEMDQDTEDAEDKSLCRTDRCTAWVADPAGKFICAARENKLVMVFLLPEGRSKSVKYKHNGTIACLTVHPTEACIAVGDTRGQIVLWRDMDGLGDPIKTTLHWHAHGVSALQFNSDGSYLMSGGEEAVLVIWQVDTGNQRFLPRLGAPFTGVAVSNDDTTYATCHTDNTIRIVDAASLEQQQAVRGLRRSPTGAPAHAIRCGLVAAPSEGQVVLNGTLGSLQLFNVNSNRVETEHQIVERTYVSRAFGEHIVETTVDHVAFSKSGEWMATVESRDDGRTSFDVRLKFWQMHSGTLKYVLATSVDPVHRAGVTSLVAHPTDKVFVTSSLDRRFKVWAFNPESDGRAAPTWNCRLVGAYLDLPCMSTALSTDGSLLAATFGRSTTLWNPVSSEMVQVLSCPSLEPLRGAVFTASQYLVSYSATHLTVWNLLTCTGTCLIVVVAIG